jgi:periplasmic protein TonB
MNEKVFLVVEQPPEFNGGQRAMYKFLAENLKYPAAAYKRRIEGSVFVSFVVEQDGSIKEASVIKGISPECDQEAIRLVLMMPKWVPGVQSGKLVRVKHVFPIKFKLE